MVIKKNSTGCTRCRSRSDPSRPDNVSATTSTVRIEINAAPSPPGQRTTGWPGMGSYVQQSSLVGHKVIDFSCSLAQGVSFRFFCVRRHTWAITHSSSVVGACPSVCPKLRSLSEQHHHDPLWMWFHPSLIGYPPLHEHVNFNSFVSPLPLYTARRTVYLSRVVRLFCQCHC